MSTLSGPLLAIDTTLGACSAAVGDESGVFAARFEETGTGQAVALIPMIDAVLKEAAIAPAALARMAVTIGPGSFAGTRIGLSAARAMALVLGIPLIGLSSLEAVAWPFAEAVPRIVAFDARKGELYVQSFDAQGRARTAPAALTLEAAARALAPLEAGTVILGSGAAALTAHLGKEGAARAPDWPDAAAFLPFAARRPPEDGALKPLYLRASGALPYRKMGE